MIMGQFHMQALLFGGQGKGKAPTGKTYQLWDYHLEELVFNSWRTQYFRILKHSLLLEEKTAVAQFCAGHLHTRSSILYLRQNKV